MRDIKSACIKFIQLSIVAGRHGGMWVSASGSTAEIAAEIIADHFGIFLLEARDELIAAGRFMFHTYDWYSELFYYADNPLGYDEDECPIYRFDVRLIARTACR